MKDPMHDIELIERYFDNTLSPQERMDVAERLKKDFSFQKLFDQERLLVSTIRFEAADRDLQYLDRLEKSVSERQARKKEIYYYLAAAACVALLIVALLVPISYQSPQSLYTAYFEPHPNVFEPVLRSQSPTSVRSMAFQAYEEKDYERASRLFAEALRANRDAGMLMLQGNANLMTGKTGIAIENFTTLINDFNDLDVAAKWYLALCYLQTGDKERASSLLKEIGDSQTPYAAKADEVLRRLR